MCAGGQAQAARPRSTVSLLVVLDGAKKLGMESNRYPIPGATGGHHQMKYMALSA